MNSVRSITLSLKYQRFTPLVSKDKRIRKFEFVAKAQFLCLPKFGQYFKRMCAV